MNCNFSFGSYLLALLLLGGCQSSNNSSSQATTVHKPVIATNDATAQPDNTAINQRDQSPTALLPTDQGNNQQDVEMSAEVRQRILRNKELSVDARNVKVITRDGNVTLRGPVTSAAERELIQRIARDVAGPDHVSDLLEVKTTE